MIEVQKNISSGMLAYWMNGVGKPRCFCTDKKFIVGHNIYIYMSIRLG